MTNGKFIFKHAAILFVIAFVCSLILILCNNMTYGRIAALQKQSEDDAKSAVLPAAQKFEDADSKQLSDDTITAAYRGCDSNGKTVGYCFKVEPSGFGGKISMIIGIDKDGNVSGVRITDMSETPGLGAKANDESWISQFVGKSGEISVVKTGNAKKSEINAISGATITSKAVTSGVNSALAGAKILAQKEGK